MNHNSKNIIADFVKYCQQELNIQELPSIKLISDKNWVSQFRSFGEYNPGTRSIKVYYLGRNTADVLRSLGHELVHHRQEELGMIEAMSGETGSEIENEANALAGILLRDFGKQNVEIYDLDNQLNELKISVYPKQQGADIDDPEGELETAPTVNMPLSKLVLNEPAIKMQSPESKETLKNLIKAIKAGKPLPPIVVRKLGDKYQILDGHHRYFAMKVLGIENTKAIIVDPKDIEVVKHDYPLNEIGEDLSSAYDWKYVGGYNPTYTFTTGETPYKVIFRDEGEGLYELIYTPVSNKSFKKDPLAKKHSDTMTAEHKAIPINATVTSILVDFLKNNKDWHTVIAQPIDPRRYKLIARFFYNNLSKDYNVEEAEGMINITRKVN